MPGAREVAVGLRCGPFHRNAETRKEQERQSGYDTANYVGAVHRPLSLAVRACTRPPSSEKREPVSRFFVSGVGAWRQLVFPTATTALTEKKVFSHDSHHAPRRLAARISGPGDGGWSGGADCAGARPKGPGPPAR